MNGFTARLVAKGLATWIPGYLAWHRAYRARPPRRDDPLQYAYSVWLRHLVLAGDSGLDTRPQAVGELGPGSSMGVGVCALLCGATSYVALDAAHFASRALAAGLVPGLADLLRQRRPIPGAGRHKPALASCDFPHHILTDERLAAALAPPRVAAVTEAVRTGHCDGLRVDYVAPWDDPAIVPAGSLDMVLSQAVLEHVEHIDAVHAAVHRWLKPGGFVSHQIDYKSHGTAATWDGHWAHSDAVWALVCGRRRAEINRLPHSAHVEKLQRPGLRLTRVLQVSMPATLQRRTLAPRFRMLSDDDLGCAGALLQAVK